jgi:DNA repair exonuclease SbcCD ATPase subunit
MVTVPLLLLSVILLCGVALWRFGRPKWMVRAPSSPEVAAPPASTLVEGPVPERFEEDLLEQEDLQWALQQRRLALEREKTFAQTREGAARIDALEDGLSALERRLGRLQASMQSWKAALLELDELRTAHELLQNEHLDLQYRLQSLQEEGEDLKQELAESRREVLDELEEKEALRRQLAVLRNLTRDE